MKTMKHRYLEIMRSGTPGLVELVLRSLLICCVYLAFQNEEIESEYYMVPQEDGIIS